jgi:hypothetical protein
MGIKSISHNTTPTTIRVITISIKGISVLLLYY